jgi:hypothetical protein
MADAFARENLGARAYRAPVDSPGVRMEKIKETAC